MSPTPLVVVLTKTPVPGRVKTRLSPALGPEGAAALHEAMVLETLALVQASDLPMRVSLAGDLAHPFAHRLRDLGVELEAQASGDLGARLRHALRGPGRRIALGTDCLVFDPDWLCQAARSPAPVVFGPSDDGGYWTVAIDAPCDTLFERISWSTEHVLEQSLERARCAGLAVELLPTCYDIDTPPSLARLRQDPCCPEAIRDLLP